MESFQSFLNIFNPPDKKKEVLTAADIIGQHDLHSKASLSAQLPPEQALAAEAQICAANPGVDFSGNAIRARKTWCDRLPEQVACTNLKITKAKNTITSENRKLQEWQSTLHDYTNLLPLDENITKLRTAANTSKKKRGSSHDVNFTTPSKKRRRKTVVEPEEDEEEDDDDDGDYKVELPDVPTRTVSSTNYCTTKDADFKVLSTRLAALTNNK